MFIPYCKPCDRLPGLVRMSTRLDLNLDFVHAFMDSWDSPDGFTVQEIISSALPTSQEDLPHVKDVCVCLRFDRALCNWIPRIVRSMERFDHTFKVHRANFTRLESFTDIGVVWKELDGFRGVTLTRWTSKDGLSLNSAALATHRKQCTDYHWCRQEDRNIDHMPFTALDLAHSSSDSDD